MSRSTAIPGIDEQRLTDWMVENLPGTAAPLTIERLAGGRSNLTYRVSDARGRAVVVRRPPLGDVPRTAHDVLREARLLAAVAGQVPVPRVLATCADPSVTGAPFIVVELLAGDVLRSPADAEALPGEVRAIVGPSLIDTMVSLHRVEPSVLEGGRLAGRTDYVHRQLRRWDETWRRTRTRELGDLAAAHAWLAAHAPEQVESAIVHGDFRVDNCLLDRNGTVCGVLDWELCSVGDPLADLGQLLVYWAEPSDGFTALHSPPTTVPGFHDRRRLAERYQAATGAPEERIHYFTVFNWWKTACIVENVFTRMQCGAMGRTDRSPGSFGEQAAALAAHARRLTTGDPA